MEHINFSSPLTTPKDVMLEQFQIVAEEVMPHFRGAARTQRRGREIGFPPPPGLLAGNAAARQSRSGRRSPRDCFAPPAREAAGQGSVGISAVLQGADPPEPVAGPQPEGIGKAGIAKPAMPGRAAERAFRRPGKRKASIREQTLGPATHNPGLGCFR